MISGINSWFPILSIKILAYALVFQNAFIDSIINQAALKTLLKFFIQIIRSLSLKTSKIGWAHGKIEHKIYVLCNFLLLLLKTFVKHLYIHKFPFKSVIFLIIEYKMYLQSLQKLRYLGWISKQDTLRLAVKKTLLNSWKEDFVKKLYLVHKKKTEHSFEHFLSICVF